MGEDRLRTYDRGLLGVAVTKPALADDNFRSIATSATALAARAIAADPGLFAKYTWAPRLVLMISDGSAVLGLGDLGPRACLPVLEAKCALLKLVAGLDAVPLVFANRGVGAIVEALTALRPSFGAVSIEDVGSPRCFPLERRLREALDCPVLHNDQHGTAVAATAALRNAATLCGKDFEALRVVVVGAGAAGIATGRLLASSGVRDVVLLDRHGTIVRGRPHLSEEKHRISLLTNHRGVAGGLVEALDGADALVGLSTTRIDPDLLHKMSGDPIVLALANPDPEIDAEAARSVGAIYGSGRAEKSNCVSSSLAVPGIFRGALAAGAVTITDAMLRAAVDGLVRATQQRLAPDHIVPGLADTGACEMVSSAVAAAANGPDG